MLELMMMDSEDDADIKIDDPSKIEKAIEDEIDIFLSNIKIEKED